MTNQARTKALSDQMLFRSISKCCFYKSFSHCCHCYILFVLLLSFFFWCDTWSALVSKCKTLSRESLNSLRKHFPWIHGVADSMTGGASLHHLSDGYIYINLPPIFMCLLSVVLMHLSKKDLLFYFICCCSLWPRTHDHKERVPGCALSTCCCWRENYCLCEYIPKWLTAHLCVCTLL